MLCWDSYVPTLVVGGSIHQSKFESSWSRHVVRSNQAKPTDTGRSRASLSMAWSATMDFDQQRYVSAAGSFATSQRTGGGSG